MLPGLCTFTQLASRQASAFSSEWIAKMTLEEILISAVSDYPELYDSTLNAYKDSDRKAKAWRAVSLQVEMPEEDCRRKWKSLRDMFIKDKRSEQRRRASGGTHRSWKYSWQMDFLTPFIQSKTGPGTAAALEQASEQDDEEREDDRSSDRNPNFVMNEVEGEHSGVDAHAHYRPSGSHTASSRKRKWQADPHRVDGLEDEMFLFSLLPYLKRLSYSKKSAVKLKIHQILYEAEFQ